MPTTPKQPSSPKNAMLNKASQAVFGQGLVGKALGKSFMNKFGDKEDTRVERAESAQSQAIDANNFSLKRIEKIVMNIADNIYNIAGVWSNHVTSMKEAEKIRQQEMSREKAGEEENTAEALGGPNAAGTTPLPEGVQKQGVMGKMFGAITNTKTKMSKFLFSAKGLLTAIGVGALGLAATSAMAYDNPGEAQQPVATSPASSAPVSVTPSAPTTTNSNSNTTSSLVEQPSISTLDTPYTSPPTSPPTELNSSASMMTAFADMIRANGGERGASDAKAMTSMMGAGMSGNFTGFVAAAQQHNAENPPPPPPPPPSPPPTLAAALPPVAGTSQKDSEAEKLKDYFNLPENAADRAQLDTLWDRQQKQKAGIISTKRLISQATTPEEKARHEDVLKNQLEPGLEATKALRQAILNRGRQKLGITTTAPVASADGALKGAEASLKRTDPEMVGGGGGGGDVSASVGGGGGGGGGTMVPSSASSGSSINTQSVSNAANSIQPPSNQVTSLSAPDSETGSKAGEPLPSPIANRGSLDKNTLFYAQPSAPGNREG